MEKRTKGVNPADIWQIIDDEVRTHRYTLRELRKRAKNRYPFAIALLLEAYEAWDDDQRRPQADADGLLLLPAVGATNFLTWAKRMIRGRK